MHSHPTQPKLVYLHHSINSTYCEQVVFATMDNSSSSSSNSFEDEDTILNTDDSGFDSSTLNKSRLSSEFGDMSFYEIEGVEHQKLGDKPITREEENCLLEEDTEVDKPKKSKKSTLKRHRLSQIA